MSKLFLRQLLKFRRFSHLLLPFAHLKCLCVAARYFVKKYVRFFQIHFQLWGSSAVVKLQISHVDCLIFHKAFWKTFPSQQENFLFMKNNIEHSGRQSLPHSGRHHQNYLRSTTSKTSCVFPQILTAIYEEQHWGLPVWCPQYMSLPAQSVSVVDFIHNSLSGEKYFEIA